MTNYTVVPVDPTEEMLKAGIEPQSLGDEKLHPVDLMKKWAAMLAAAPQANITEEDVGYAIEFRALKPEHPDYQRDQTHVITDQAGNILSIKSGIKPGDPDYERPIGPALKPGEIVIYKSRGGQRIAPMFPELLNGTVVEYTRDGRDDAWHYLQSAYAAPSFHYAKEIISKAGYKIDDANSGSDDDSFWVVFAEETNPIIKRTTMPMFDVTVTSPLKEPPAAPGGFQTKVLTDVRTPKQAAADIPPWSTSTLNPIGILVMSDPPEYTHFELHIQDIRAGLVSQGIDEPTIVKFMRAMQEARLDRVNREVMDTLKDTPPEHE